MKNRNAIVGIGTALGAGFLLGVIISARSKRGTHKIIIEKGQDVAGRIDQHIDRRFAQMEKRIESLARTLTGEVV